jgi:glycosyltransferase involved in cell wall biosynthesis
MLPKVSIICPIFNGQRYLRESVESVLAQTFGDFELLLWDDGSTDNSLTMATSYKKDSRVRVSSNLKNRGLFGTLNEAIRIARGAVIRLWSQDDVMRPTCLETESRYLDAFPDVPLAYSYYHTIDSQGMIRSKRPDTRGCHVKSPLCCLEIMFYHGSITGNIANISIRRKLFEEVGLFREDLVYAGDFEFLARVGRSHPMCCIFDPLLFLRGHSEQFSQSAWAYSHSMTETEDIFAMIARSLSKGVAERERQLYDYHWFDRRMQRLNHIVRQFIAGDLKGAKQTYKTFSGLPDNRVFRLAVLYVLTLNRRWRPRRFKASYSPEVAREIAFDSCWQHGLHGPHYSELSAVSANLSGNDRLTQTSDREEWLSLN